MLDSLIKRAFELMQQQQFQAASTLYQQVLQQQPSHSGALYGLATIALARHQYDDAISLLQHVCQQCPNELQPLLDLGQAFSAVGSDVDHKTVLNYALKRFNQPPEILYELARYNLVTGDIAQAIPLFETLLTQGNMSLKLYALFELAKIQSHKSNNYLSLAFELQPDIQNQEQACVLEYTLAQCYFNLDKMKEFAMHLAQANQLQLQTCEFKTQDLAPFFNTLSELKPAAMAPRDDSRDSLKPIFIVGLPRTGSSLLAQMLASHSQIANAGEQPFLAQTVTRLCQRTTKPYPECLASLTPKLIEQGAAYYLANMQRFSHKKNYVIDKLPANFQSIAAIKLLFPTALIIDLRRNNCDVALSIYQNYFAQSEPYFCDLDELAHYIGFYQRTMTHFTKLYDQGIVQVHYEALVTNAKVQLSTILQQLNLSFEENCLAFYQQKLTVHTLSATQVRSQLHHKSIDRALALAPFLPKLAQFSAL
ncbi:sulfotransferase [Pseudoalteromonas tunicata]|uniref:tetratricopeptide repeat-containing sulfotransferase family protein n=1 Tax=Pseudoalteromonas tunicata TaxID=314281 RepID=UPI00273F4675|nr:tetratricopeptide repeat-containing sulfotransferase family protein [Pseudoalteromonas tunicata]MDP5214550.1 sulfotransferase [Pseudoalteromonas tunicata]